MTKQEKIESYENELKDILNDFIIPDERKHLNKHNLLWMTRNIGIQNNQHPKFYRAISLIKLLLIENK